MYNSFYENHFPYIFFIHFNKGRFHFGPNVFFNNEYYGSLLYRIFFSIRLFASSDKYFLTASYFEA